MKNILYKWFIFALLTAFGTSNLIAQNTFPSTGTFTLPAGKTIIITYEVSVNANACSPSTPVSLSAQGTVSGSNFASVLTDDPAITGTINPTIVAFNSPVINAGSTISATAICSGGSVTLNASCPNSGTLNWYDASTGGTSLSILSPFSPINITANTSYYATCTENSCEGVRTLVGSVTINPLPTITVIASPPICEGATSFTIPYTSTTATPTTYSISGTGITTVTNAALPATPISVGLSSAATGSSYSYTLTVKNANGCISSNVTGSVTVNPAPTITVSASPAICTEATSFTIPYTATTGTPTTYSISGTGITTVMNTALPATPITVNLSAGASGTSISYTLTVKNAGNCTSSNVTGSVTVNALPTLTKSASPDICAGATTFTIPYTATTNSPNTYSIAGTGITSVTDAALPNTPIVVSLSSGASSSSISYTLTVKNSNGCSSSNITGSVNVNALPTLTKSASSAICAGATSFTIPYTATTGTPTTYSISGTGITTVTDAALPATPITVNLSSGASGSSISYTLTVKNAAGCTSSNITGSVTVNSTPAPTAPTATPSSRTTAGSSTLSATGCSGGTLTWYNASTNVAVPSPNNQPNLTTQGTFNFYAKCTGANTCVSDASTNVSVTVSLCTPLASSPGNVNITWTGLVSTDWNTACNWNPAWVPDATNGSVIITNTANKPVITGTVPDVKVIEINQNAFLTVNSGGTLNIRGNGIANKGITIDRGYLYNNGTINVESIAQTAILASIYLINVGGNAYFENHGTVNINSTDKAFGFVGVSTISGNVNNYSTGIINIKNGIGVEVSSPSDVIVFYNQGTFNYDGSVLALSMQGASNFTSIGAVNINSGTGILNKVNSEIRNTYCATFLMATGTYTNEGSTNNSGLMQMPNTYNFTNTGTFTNTGVLKANTVSNITNNKIVITNTCPIFTIANSTGFTFNGIFTDNVATTSAGIYTPSSNRFVANNIIPTGIQTLYAKITSGVSCSYSVPFDFNNELPTTVSVNSTTVCAETSVTLSATCASGTPTWYTTATGGSNIGTGASLSHSPTVATTYYVACEATNCVSGRVATRAVSVSQLPTASANSNSPICAGATLNLISGSVGNTYLWAGPNSFASTELSPSIANTTTLATGTYTITVTNASSCTATATVAVTVNAVPTATASSNSPVCVGNTLSLTGGGVGSGPPPAYFWNGPNGYSSTAQSPTIASATVLATGTYTITVTGTGSCNSTATTAVIVNANPTATASSSTPVICAGNSISLTGGGVGTYAWTGVNGFTSTDQSPSIPNASILASGTYKITVTNINGCTSTATTSITVNATPMATASSNAPVCAGTSLSLTGGGVGTSYAWTGPNSYTSTAQSPSISSSTVLASGVYKITVNNVNGCTSTATTSVTVNPLPVVDAGANQTICEGSTASLTAICNLLTVNTTLSGANEVPANASTATGTVSGTFDKVSKQLLLTFTFNGLAANASAAHLHKAAVGVNGPVLIPFSDVPTATLGSFTYTGTLTSLQETDLLAGLYYANIHNASFSGGEIRGQLSTACVANNFVWNPGNLSGQTVTVSPTSNQLYTVTASNTTTGCSTTATTTVNVNPRPVVTIGSNTPVCAGNTLTLNGGGGTSYAWTGPNTFTATGASPSIASVTLLATGTYTVTVTNVNGCTNTATTAVVINALPTTTASSNSPICSGATLNLIGGGLGSYLWTGPGSYTSMAQSPNIPSATSSMSGTYTLTVTNVNGCTSTATTSVTVNPVSTTPTPQVNTQIIFGASFTLTATGCSGVNDLLKWYKSSDNSLAVMPVSPTATTNYYAKCETTLNGITCTSGNSTDVTVTVLQPQPPVATGATICAGGSVTLTATGCSGSTGTFVLKWYLNATDALVTMPVSPTTNTDFYAKCEQTFNSVTAISGKSNVVTVIVLNPLAPVATGGTIYLGNSITLTATGCTGAGFSIKWYQTYDNVLVTLPVSPTVTTQYYAKCEQMANSITCLSVKSNDVTVTVVNRIFVDITKIAAPIQNGNSWATAYGNLQTGLSAAAAVVVSAPAEVWVAQGTYKPTTTTTRTIYFTIPSNVIVYGGFAGTENALNDRNFRTNTTILSGDVGTVNLASDNSYHVVTFDGSSNTTVLDGFTITGGYANFDPRRVVNAPVAAPPTTSTIETGGGIVVQNAGSPMIANCTIVNNTAVTGGGIYAGDASLPKIVACKIMSNQATFGAAVYFQDGSNGSFSNSLISGNRGIGAVYNNTSNPSITNCTIAGNGGYNGGIFNSASQPVVKNSIIWNNSTPFNDTQSIITYSTIQGGYAGTGNLNYDPKFVNPIPDGLSPTLNGDYHLQASSLAIDRGDNTGISLTDKDLDGNLRRYNGGTVDMGAYEFQGVATSNLVISAQTGDWEINSTWVGFKVPTLGDVVIIDANHIVTINTTATAKSIEYRATGQVKFKTAVAKLNIGF